MLKKGGSKGFTLMEMVIGSLVVAVGIVALLSAFLSGLILVETSRNTLYATADARTVLEEMRRASERGLPAVVATDWSRWWAQRPNTPLDAGSPVKGTRISVRFANPNADPLEATVTYSWTERNRPRSLVLTGLITRRQ